jgi:invasion protein IalB
MQVAFRTFSSDSVIRFMQFSSTLSPPQAFARPGPVQPQTQATRNCCVAVPRLTNGRAEKIPARCAARRARGGGLTGSFDLLGNGAPRCGLFSAHSRRRNAPLLFGEIMSLLRAATSPGPLRHLVAGILGAALAAVGGAALAQGVVKSKYGDWEIRCETPAGAAAEQCALVQSVVAEDKNNVNLVVIVLKTSDGKSRLLRVVAPLGVLLPNGLGLKIDQTDIGRAGFVKCLPTGCVAEVMMDDKLVDQLKNGKMATFIIHQVPEEGIGLPLTLQGFKEGFAKLP